MGTPPTINFLAEMLSVVTLVAFRKILSFPIAMLVFLAAAYSLILYASTQQGQRANSLINSLRLSLKDALLIFNHTF